MPLRRFRHLLLPLLLVAGAGRLSGQAVVVVVNAENPAAALTRAEIANIFLKRTTRFPGGKPATPVDQAKGAAVRETFSRELLQRSARTVLSFWQQQIFAGKDAPPPERPSDAEVLAFVRASQGGIGYVAVGTPLIAGVKVLVVR